MKNILIFYGTYGGGHLSAAKSLRDYIADLDNNYNVEIMDCVEYSNKIFNKFSTKIYSGMAKNAPKVWGKVYHNADFGLLGRISNDANKVMAKKLIKYIYKFNPDLIISVLPFASNMCAYLKKKGRINCKFATIMTDFALHSQWLNYLEFTDFVFVAQENMRKELINRGYSSNKVFTFGIPISPRFSLNYDKNIICKNFGLSTNKPIGLFFGGGELGFGKNLTEHVFKTFISNFKDIQIVAIAGKNEKMKIDFENIVETVGASNMVKVLGFTNQVPELMSIADFVVSKSGGLTTSECMASSVPMFVISPLPGQEEDNAKFIEDNGTGYWLKKNDDVVLRFKNFLNNLDNMKIACNNIGRKNSTRDICNMLLE